LPLIIANRPEKAKKTLRQGEGIVKIFLDRAWQSVYMPRTIG